MINNLRIAVIILTYKRPDELKEVLENILLLVPPPDEIIVYDDDPAASGRDISICAGKDVRYFCSGKNLGPAGARNAAACRAKSDILIYIDDDCRLLSLGVIATVRELFASPDLCCAAFLIKNEFTRKIVPKEFPGYHWERWAIPQDVSYFLAGGFAIRRQVFIALEGFDPLLFHGDEEVELSFRLLNTGCRIAYTPAVEFTHRENPEGRENIRRSYRLIRNRVYLAIKHLPLPFLLSHLLLWGGFALLQAIRGHEFNEYWRGLISLWREGLLRQALIYRRAHRMTWQTVKYMWRHEGRLWY